MPADSTAVRQSIQELTPNINVMDIATSMHSQKISDALLASAHEAGYRLLAAFDEFCTANNIGYFAVDDTLMGAISYQDFIPGTAMLEVGMVRSEYLKFEAAFYEQGGLGVTSYPYPNANEYITELMTASLEQRMDLIPDDDKVDIVASAFDESKVGRLIGRAKKVITGKGAVSNLEFLDTMEVSESEHVRFVTEPSPLPFTLMSHHDEARTYHVCDPSVQLPGYCIAMKDGCTVYGIDQLPVVFGVQVVISVFDPVPNDYDSARFLFKRLKAIDAVCEHLPEASGQVLWALRDRAWTLANSYAGYPHRAISRLVPVRGTAIPLDSLFPTWRVPFGPGEISVPCDTSKWVIENIQSQTEQIEILQSDAAKVIGEIDRICRENGIGYFVCGGTMLGYVRHGGFIPWDDDMDIGMLRADYEKFLEIAPKQLDSSQFFLQTRKSDPNIPYLFSKMRLKNSEYVTGYNEYRNFNKGICVDIFPFDRVPFETGDMQSFSAEMAVLIRDHNRLANRQVGEMPSEDPRTTTDRIAREIMTIRHERYWHRSLADTQAAFEKLATSCNDQEGLNYVASFVPTFTMVRLDELLPYQDIDFDGLKLMAPAHPEVFLSMQYGDFMTMPLPHMQRGHNLIWWSDPERDAAEFGTQKPTHANVEHHTSKLLPLLKPAAAACAAVAVAGIALKVALRKRG